MAPRGVPASYAKAMTRLREHDKSHRPGTRAIHAGRIDDQNAGAIMPPIYQTSTYRQDGLGQHKGYEYGRTQNPTREALERNVASLEGAEYGFAFGSGSAALDAVLKLFKSGDHIICGDNVYGGTMRAMVRVFQPLGLSFSFVDMRDPENVARAVTPATRMVFCETPTNPMMFLADLSAIGDICQAQGLLYAVDNTFASPIFQRPLELGAELVLHSTTKFLNGHSDMIGGIVVTSREDLAERIGFLQNATGAVPGPLDCWLALRGIKTLPVRMARHDSNGRAVATWLAARTDIQAVYYPGLISHPQHDLAKRQMTGFGGMISFETGSVERARRIVGATRIFALAESLGGVESLIGHPASQTHASVPASHRQAIGLTDGLVRLSVGIEEIEDLIEDLDQAMAAK